MKIKIKCTGSDFLTLDEMKDFQGNLKVLSDENKRKLKANIIKRGFRFPFFVWRNNGTNWINDGHQRHRILPELADEGYEIPEKYPVCYIEAKNKKEAAELILEQSSIFGEITLEGLENFGLDYDLNLNDLDINLAGIDLDFKSEIDDSDIPESQINRAEELQKKWKVKLGQVWKIGRHRLMCGDARSADDVELLMKFFECNDTGISDCKLCNSQGILKAKMIFTDPPYGVDYSSRGDKLKGDKLSELPNLLKRSFKNMFNISYEGCVAYIWHEDQKEDVDIIFKKEFINAGFFWGGKIIWVKNVASMGWNDYRYQYELCLYGWKGKHKFYGDRTNTNVWQVARDNVNDYKHPTQKPVELALKAIENSSRIDDLIIDFFVGAGVTFVGAEKLNRICYGMEIEPKYCAVTLERMSEMGLEPKLINT